MANNNNFNEDMIMNNSIFTGTSLLWDLLTWKLPVAVYIPTEGLFIKLIKGNGCRTFSRVEHQTLSKDVEIISIYMTMRFCLNERKEFLSAYILKLEYTVNMKRSNCKPANINFPNLQLLLIGRIVPRSKFRYWSEIHCSKD